MPSIISTKTKAERKAMVTKVDAMPGLDALNAWLEDDDDCPCGQAEYDAFVEYLDGNLEPEDFVRDMFLDWFAEWRCSSEYERWVE